MPYPLVFEPQNYHSHCCFWLRTPFPSFLSWTFLQTSIIWARGVWLPEITCLVAPAEFGTAGSQLWLNLALWDPSALSHCVENTFGRRTMAASQIHPHPFKFLSCSAVAVLLHHLSERRHSCFVTTSRRPFGDSLFVRNLHYYEPVWMHRKWNRKGAGPWQLMYDSVCMSVWCLGMCECV